MNKADYYYKKNLKEILDNGTFDKDPRPKWEDGTPAHSKFITQVFEEYDISKGEIPIPTLRNTATKMGIKEILTIFQSQSNTKKAFEGNGVFWWESWFNENGDIGRSYPYNLESHRIDEMKRETIVVNKTEINNKENYISIEDNGGYEGDFLIKNDDDEYHLQLWYNMLRDYGKYILKDWLKFSNFYRDVKYIKQYHLAKEDEFCGWVLSTEYFKTEYYSTDTVVFIKRQEHVKYKNTPRDENMYRFELSRNQMNDLLFNLKNNPFGRRHIISFWNWANIDKKELVECAYETIWSVRDIDGEYYIDMTLTQRSNDYVTAGYINKIQYTALMMMVAGHLGYKVGKFCHLVQNLHIYDRHLESAQFLLEKEPLDIQPELILKNKKDFYEYTIDDFEIKNIDGITKLDKKLEIAV